MEEGVYLLAVLHHHIVQGLWDACDIRLEMYVVGHDAAEFLKLLHHRRYYGPHHSCQHSGDSYHGDDDGYGTDADAHAVLDKLHDGEDEIGQKPCYEEWQQGVAEIIDKPEGAEGDGKDYDPANEAVECYFLIIHCQCEGWSVYIIQKRLEARSLKAVPPRCCMFIGCRQSFRIPGFQSL